MKAAYLMLFAALTAAPLPAQNSSPQNSDVAILFGFSYKHGPGYKETDYNLYVTYARQFFESAKGRLYFEAPAGPLFVVPGLRYQFNVKPRFALYAAAGAGVFSSYLLRLNNDGRYYPSWRVGPGYDFGGGVDYRLTRMLSLRGECRRFRFNENGFGVPGPRTVPAAQFGIAFHF